MSGVTDADRAKARELQADLGWQELVYPTPKQLIAYLRQCPDAVAEECASRLIAASQEASWCWQGNHERQLEYLRAALAEEREKGIDIGLRNATSIDHYEVGHCCRLCGQTWPCDRAETVGLR